MTDSLRAVAGLMSKANVAYAVIGAHAVNAWLEPRFTADIDVTVQASRDEMERLRRTFQDAGYRVEKEFGADQPSGPD